MKADFLARAAHSRPQASFPPPPRRRRDPQARSNFGKFDYDKFFSIL
jgi:hypothetical protein